MLIFNLIGLCDVGFELDSCFNKNGFNCPYKKKLM